MKRVAAGILIGWASASLLMLTVLCWRSLREPTTPASER